MHKKNHVMDVQEKLLQRIVYLLKLKMVLEKMVIFG